VFLNSWFVTCVSISFWVFKLFTCSQEAKTRLKTEGKQVKLGGVAWFHEQIYFIKFNKWRSCDGNRMTVAWRPLPQRIKWLPEHYKPCWRPLSKSVTGTLFIITTIRHELGLDRPVSVSSCSPFKGLPSHLSPFGIYFSIIFDILLFIFLLNVVANLICIFLISRQLVVLVISTLSKFLHFFLW
jgi:hypothetical protein